MSAELWPAPGKLNLFLHVCGRRPDGYHELQTVFQLLDYGDELVFDTRADGEIRRLSGAAQINAADDLCVRAAQLLRTHTGCRLGADIRLTKRLPIGGGLGGGSSDAATTLVALNTLWGLGLSEDELAGLGLRLGADVPVFVRGFSAWGEGVGEQLTPVSLPTPYYLILFPECAVSTAAVFADPELTRDTPRITMTAFRAGRTRNDCEPVVRRLYAPVAEAIDWLGQFAPARLTGTGGCVFAAFAEEEAANRILAGVPERWRAFVARGVDVSPLRLKLQRRAA